LLDLSGIEVLRTIEDRVSPGHTAVLVVDMQNDYCSPEGASDRNGRDLAQIRAIIPNVCGLIGAARHVGVPICFTKYTLGPGTAGLSGPEILRRGENFAGLDSTIKGTWGHALIDELPLDPEHDSVVEKRRLSAFAGTDLDMILRGLSVKTLVVAGVVTQGCVESTVREAVSHDYYVAVPRDCCASVDLDAHETALKSMARFLRYAEAVTDLSRLRAIWQAP
jgi:nicotinamidase-related amidase